MGRPCQARNSGISGRKTDHRSPFQRAGRRGSGRKDNNERHQHNLFQNHSLLYKNNQLNSNKVPNCGFIPVQMSQVIQASNE